MGKPKYQLPHFDRCAPGSRWGVRAGALIRLAFMEAEQQPQPDGSFRVQLDLKGVLKQASESQKGPWDLLDPGHYWEAAAEWMRAVGAWEDMPTSAKQFQEEEMAACHLYNIYGRQVFSLTPLMQEMFTKTDMGSLTLDDVKMPFPCFYVSLEGDRITLGGRKPLIDGFYVYRTAKYLGFVGVGFRDCLNEVWPDDRPDVSEEENDARSDYFRYFFSINLEHWESTTPLEHVALSILRQNEPDLAAKGTKDGLKDIEFAWHEKPDDMDLYCTAFMTQMCMSLLCYLNSDERTLRTTDQRAEITKADAEIEAGKGRGRRKKRKGREAKERRKYMSTARVTRVGEKEEAAIRARPGFDINQPRHWRRGHFHRYWTGPMKADGARIPFEDWPEKRTVVRQWLLPMLIHPDGEVEDATTRTVVKKAQEALASTLMEAKLMPIPVQSKRERNTKARRLCLNYHGRICHLCSDDGARFGDAKGWLHVHHLDPIGDAVAERKVDPRTDLIPLCATCHGFIHSRKPMLDIEEAREIIEHNAKEHAAK